MSILAQQGATLRFTDCGDSFCLSFENDYYLWIYFDTKESLEDFLIINGRKLVPKLVVD